MPYVRPDIKHDFPKRSSGDAFAEQYLELRKKEQRLYSDDEVRRLPNISTEHPHYKEWIVRRHSAARLVKHLGKLNKPLQIVEIGCGNGWLSHKLAAIKNSQVTGFDINQLELYQARKVFGDQPNLEFTAKDPLAGNAKFNVIMFAASIQYFASLHEIIMRARAKLQPGGSIHIIDTHFYEPGGVAAAQKRTENYFTSMGFATMSANYFHHSLEELAQFDHKVLYNPNSFWNKLLLRKNPFHWICIKKVSGE